MRRIGDKRGEISMSFTVQVLLGIAGSALLLLLGFRLLSPGYDSNEVGAEAYLDSLKDEINLVDRGGVGFFQIINNGKESLDYYLVYFGDLVSIEQKTVDSFFEDKKSFSYFGGVAENIICVCYWEGNLVSCKSCYNLKSPAEVIVSGSDSLVVAGNDFWIGKEGARFDIEKKGDYYVFSEV